MKIVQIYFVINEAFLVWQPGTSYWFCHFDLRIAVICVLKDSVWNDIG